MKNKAMLMLLVMSFILLVLATHAAALNRNQILLSLVVIFFGIFGTFAGAAAVILAGLHAKEYEENLPYALLIAAVGGAWSAYAWLGWPMETTIMKVLHWVQIAETREWIQDVRDKEFLDFSFIRFIGFMFFTVVGMVVCFVIAKGTSDEIQREELCPRCNRYSLMRREKGFLGEKKRCQACGKTHRVKK